MSAKRSSTLENHTAAPQLAGYFYQIQCALLRLFELQIEECLGIEIVDDVHIEEGNTVTEAEQHKYHNPQKPVSITDSSPEFWKTLGIWASAITDKSFDLSVLKHLILFTRATPAVGSVVELLAKSDSRDVDDVLARLLSIPRTKDKKLAKSFDAVHALPKDIQRMFVQKISIYAEQPSLQETLNLLRRRIRQKGFHEHSLDAAARWLCGWLWETVLRGLESPTGVQIFEADFHSAICLIRDELAGNKLPARHQDINEQEAQVELAHQEKRAYIKQLDLIGASLNTKVQSVLDYFRAMRERSDWIAAGELLPQQLEAFDQELYDRWKPRFEAMCEDLEEKDNHEELRRAGRTHFHDIQKLEVPIQTGWIHSYLTRGSYHALANRLHVGWHPHFRKML